MSTSNKWAESLGISESQLEQWAQDNNPEAPLPYHLMLKKHINEEAYLHWARQEFGLASVDRGFFVTSADAELWYAMKVEHHWNPWLLPLKIWDETLFVGCVQPPTTPLNLSLPVHYVLCPAVGLERLWKFYMGEMGVEVQPTPITVTNSPAMKAAKPDGAPAAVVPTESLANLNFGDLTATNGKITPRQKNHETATASTQQTNANFSFDFSNLALNKTDGDEAKPKPQPKAPVTPPATPPPHGLATPPQMAKPTPQVPPTPPTPTYSGTVARFELARPEMPAPKVNAKPTPAPVVPPPVTAKAPSAPTPTPIPTPVAPPPPPARPSAPPTVPPISTLKIPSVKAVSGNTSGSINLATFQMPPSLEMAKTFDQLIAYTFKEMSAHYEKCLFAAYDGPRLIVANWTHNVNVDSNASAQPLIIDKPNIFKIAHDTKKPFHGPVAPNEVNKSFFAVWNNSQIPVMVTIFPIVNGPTLLGHLIGLSSKELDVYGSLEAVAGFAAQLCAKIPNLAA